MNTNRSVPLTLLRFLSFPVGRPADEGSGLTKEEVPVETFEKFSSFQYEGSDSFPPLVSVETIQSNPLFDCRA